MGTIKLPDLVQAVANNSAHGGLGDENARAATLKWHARDDRAVRKSFPDAEEASLYVSTRPWPALDGVLCILFTSRSGSTYLSEQLGRLYAIGKIRESFNLPSLKQAGNTPAEGMRELVARLHEGPWFGVKAGRPGLTVAERCAFFGEYLQRTNFLLLLRRDLVAQSVSMVKAKITSRFHFAQQETVAARSEDYSYERIAHGVSVYARGRTRMLAYARETGRPFHTIAYEDFATGDFSTAEAACDAFGIPRRPPGSPYESRQIEKIGDSINDEWCARFRQDMDRETRREVNRQARCLDKLKTN